MIECIKKVNPTNTKLSEDVFFTKTMIENNIGKVVKVKVQNSNQNTLFGLLDKKMKAA